MVEELADDSAGDMSPSVMKPPPSAIMVSSDEWLGISHNSFDVDG